MQIHQLSVSYLPEQDRLLLRVNTREGEEMRIWLTRRLMVGLWPLLTKILTEQLLKLEGAGSNLATADESLKKMLADFRKEEFLSKADFETPYQEGPARLPLGEEPLLVSEVDVTPQAGGSLSMNFREKPPGAETPRSFQMEMNASLLQGVMHLFEQSMRQSQWREPFPGGSYAPASQPDEEPAAAQKPKYLQ